MAGAIEYLDPHDDPGRPEADDASPEADDASPGRGIDADDVVDSAPRRGHRRTLIAVLALAAVLAGVLVARAVTSGGRHDRAAAPSPTPSSQGSDPRLRQVEVVLSVSSGRVLAALCAGAQSLPYPGAAGSGPLGPRGDDLTDPSRPSSADTGGTLAGNDRLTPCATDAGVCPTDCRDDQQVPAPVAAAVARVYPTARLAEAHTEVLSRHHTLWYRDLLFALGPREALRVEVIQHRSDPPDSAETDSAAGRLTRAVGNHGRLDVLVTTSGPAGSASDLGRQERLAADGALVDP